MKRDLKPCRTAQSGVTVDPDTDLFAWLSGQMQARGLRYLLAHADDGVIWGRLEDAANTAGLITSRKIFPKLFPLLRRETVQQVRCFGENGELMVWRESETELRARYLDDSDPEDADRSSTAYFEEPVLLLGTDVVDEQDGFTLWQEGAQGMRHAVPYPPVADSAGRRRPPRLRICHYLAPGEPIARIATSRLVGFDPTPIGKGKQD